MPWVATGARGGRAVFMIDGRNVPAGVALGILVLSVSVTTSACTPAQMAVPRAMKGRSHAHLVKLDRGPMNEAVAFGKWRTIEVDRSWTTRIGAGIKFSGVGMAHETADQPYTFLLARGQERWRVECVTRFRNKATVVGPLKIRASTTRIRCMALSEGDKRRVEIASMMVGAGRVGVVKLGEQWLTLHTQHQLKGGAQIGTAAGYALFKDANMVAAVQTINDRQAWVRSTLASELHGPVAVTLASLLLYREVKASSQRIF